MSSTFNVCVRLGMNISICRASLGIANAFRSEKKDRKSIGAQRTFRPMSDKDKLLAKCRKIADEVSNSMNKRGLKV